MGILDSILSAGGGESIKELARNFGISEEDAGRAVGQLAPSISTGIRNNISSSAGLDSLINAVKNGQHQRYLDNPAELTRNESIADGNNILGHIFGSKDVSRNVAQSAAEKTGLDSSILKQMLPMVAAMAMGSISKQSNSGGMLNQLMGGSDSSGLSGMLGQFLDADKDGSIGDDLLNMAKKFF